MGITNQIPSSRLIQPGVCTSSTRPASPFEGQAIFETDTDRMLIWNGTTWVIPNQTTTNPEGFELVTTVSVAGATAIAIDNCFTSTYDNYRIMLNVYGTVASGYGQTKFRTGGSPISSGYYWTGWYATTAGLSNYSYSATGTFNAFMWGNSVARTSGGWIDIYNPKSSSTFTTFQSTLYDHGGTPTGYFLMGHNEPAASVDGIQISASSGTLTGTAYVYGYRKS